MHGSQYHLRPIFCNKKLNTQRKYSFTANLVPTTVPFCPALPANISYLLYKSDTFLTSPATEQLRMTDSISKVSSCCSVLEKTNLIMTHGFFTTSFMLPGLICRSLEIRAYCTSGLTTRKWRFLVPSITLLCHRIRGVRGSNRDGAWICLITWSKC